MMAQQESLAKEEGFVEEMLNGQKVIQVFCHEEESKSDFVKTNDQLFSDSEKAFQFGNILMPILNNVGNLMYVSLAIIGGLLLHFQVGNLSLAGIGTISVGIIISFLVWQDSFLKQSDRHPCRFLSLPWGLPAQNVFFS